MKITQFTDYALRTLIYLACSDKEVCTAKEISQCFNISWNHITRVVNCLSKHGYIKSKKGNGGGIFLARKSGTIIVGEVIRHTEANFAIVECFNTQSNKCIISPFCELKFMFSKACKAFLEELDKYTLHDIAKNKNDLHKVLHKSLF